VALAWWTSSFPREPAKDLTNTPFTVHNYTQDSGVKVQTLFLVSGGVGGRMEGTMEGKMTPFCPVLSGEQK